MTRAERQKEIDDDFAAGRIDVDAWRKACAALSQVNPFVLAVSEETGLPICYAGVSG